MIAPADLRDKDVAQDARGHCAVCEGNKGTRRRGWSDRALYECSRCGTAWIWPQPSRDSLRKLYNQTAYHMYYRCSGSVDYDEFERRIRLIASANPTPRVLDVGCALGGFLAVARERGWTGVGLEISAEAADIARKERAITVLDTSDTGTFCFREKVFDVVTAWDVIEHCEDPRRLVLEAARVLRPGGILALSTPDYRNWLARLLQVKPEEHLWYFTSESLTLLLSQVGFKSIEVRGWSRRRSVEALSFGTTFKAGAPRVLFQAAVRTGFLRLLNALVFRLVHDDLLVVAVR